jgi:hypothetical protein
MQYAVALGKRIQQQWSKFDCHLDAFPDTARQALSEMPPHEHIRYQEIARWVLEADSLPRQLDMTEQFGQPPVTLYTNERFDIDAYFWLDGSTAIHEHGFCGAFCVLHGSSVHSTFAFEPRRVYNHRLMTGELKVEHVEMLQAGDIRPILAGHQQIHSLFHLDRPSVTIVVRANVPGAIPQLSYEWPCLAYATSTYDTPLERRKRQVMAMLRRINDPDFVNTLTETLLQCEPYQMYTLLDANRSYFKGKAPQLRGLLQSLRSRFGELIDDLIAVFRHDTRIRAMYELRRFVHLPEHRFFLALLVNATRCDTLMTLTAQRFPGQDPVEKIVQWISEFDAIEVDPQRQVNALGLKLNERSLPALRTVLQPASSLSRVTPDLGNAGTPFSRSGYSNQLDPQTVQRELARMRSHSVLASILTA